MQKTILIALGIVAAAIILQRPIIIKDSPTGIEVSGNCTKSVKQDKIGVSIRIANLAKTKNEAMAKTLASYEIASKYAEELKKSHLNIEIATANIASYEKQEWNEAARRSISKGFEATATLSFKTDIADKKLISDIIAWSSDTLNDAEIQNFGPSVSQKLRKSELESCLVEATANAREKAEKIAAGANRKVGGLISATQRENFYAAEPVMFEAAPMLRAKSAAPAPEIFTRDAELSIFVDAVFEVR